MLIRWRVSVFYAMTKIRCRPIRVLESDLIKTREIVCDRTKISNDWIYIIYEVPGIPWNVHETFKVSIIKIELNHKNPKKHEYLSV